MASTRAVSRYWGHVVAPAAVEWDALTGKTWDGDHLFLSTLLEFTNT